VSGRILAAGGRTLGTAFDDLVVDIATGPRVLFVPTAAGDPAAAIVSFYDAYAHRAEPPLQPLASGGPPSARPVP
jgi:hypothetical protein